MMDKSYSINNAFSTVLHVHEAGLLTCYFHVEQNFQKHLRTIYNKNLKVYIQRLHLCPTRVLFNLLYTLVYELCIERKLSSTLITMLTDKRNGRWSNWFIGASPKVGVRK